MTPGTGPLLNPRAYFTGLAVLPVIVTAPGLYVTREGLVVQVDVAGGKAAAFDCTGAYPNGVREHWHRSGRLYFGQPSCNDIVRAAHP